MQYRQRRERRDGSIDQSCIIRDNDNGSTTTIPNDLDNRDWREYQEWLAAGNTPNPPAEN